MSLENSTTTSDFLQWDEALSLVSKLERDEEYTFSLLIAAGIFTGLRISDIKSLRWTDLLESENISLNEKKTGKKRLIKINPLLQGIAKRLYLKIGQPMEDEIFSLSIQYINRKFKQIKVGYKLKINHISSHSLRKTFGRRVWEMDNHSEKALIMLSEIFNHSGTAITRKYLGIRAQEISNIYELL